jgi:serine/threonine protein kinase
MGLATGTRLGSYEIIDAIGAGGMGEVYRARDLKLGREVALKVLPSLFTDDPDRLTRFDREARLLASLNHPNIAHVYGLEQGTGDVRAIAMELVDGATIAEIIAQRALPVSEVLTLARQIAAALESAHDAGIIHRDLKPANIKVREDGTVKVLDFGLAKALEAPGEASGGATNSPTLTARATQLGMVLGTAAYMSPEQAKGKTVDRRADVWAFGAVLYEMLTRRRAFDGDDISEVMAAVLKIDPDWSALPADVPEPVRRLLRRCLEKDPKRRLRDVAEGMLQLDVHMSITSMASVAMSGVHPAQIAAEPAPRPSIWRRALPIASAVVGVAGIASPRPSSCGPSPFRLAVSSDSRTYRRRRHGSRSRRITGTSRFHRTARVWSTPASSVRVPGSSCGVWTTSRRRRFVAASSGSARSCRRTASGWASWMRRIRRA